MHELRISPPSFWSRVGVNHLIFLFMACVYIGYASIRDLHPNLNYFLGMINVEQYLLLIVGALAMYLVIAIIEHQSRNLADKSRAKNLIENLHGELSSIFLNISSLSLSVSVLIWKFSPDWHIALTLLYWAVCLLISYFLRPKSQDQGLFNGG